MHPIKWLNSFVWLSACLASPAFADAPPALQTRDRAVLEACSAFSQSGMRECLVKEEAASRARLRQVEGRMAAALSKWDEDATYVDQARATLAASGREFGRYRDAQCALARSLRGGAAGNGRETARLACISALNNERAEQLLDMAADLLSR